MRRPLSDVLSDHPDLADAKDREEAEAHLETLFLTAQNQANAYAAERLQEVYELTERALALAAAFPPPPPEEEPEGRGAWIARVPRLLSRFGGGLLLAASAPLVAETSAILAIACGVGAVLTLSTPFRRRARRLRLEGHRAVGAKFEGLVSAADRSLDSMTAPRALEAPRPSGPALEEDDMLGFLQDALMLEGHENEELRRNAERLAGRAGYRVVREEDPDVFEVMVDPAVERPILLKPALVHRKDATRTVFGVIVRGRR